jgi:hypothetical protein
VVRCREGLALLTRITGGAYAAYEDTEDEDDMYRTTLRWLGRTAVIRAAIILAACNTEAPIGPDRAPSRSTRRQWRHPTAASVRAVAAHRGPDLGDCDSLRVAGATRLAFHAFATGVQIYRWSGSSVGVRRAVRAVVRRCRRQWGGRNPLCGPTWESNSGSKVVGAVLKRCPGAPNAIPWLLPSAVSAEGPGVFNRVTHIQRVNTVGGNAPAGAGTVVGETANVPYTAEYFFYRAQ